MPRRVESLNDVKLWIAANDARIDAQWHFQNSWNRDIEKKLYSFGLRLGGLEKRVAWIAGACSAGGGIIGALLTKWV